MTVNWKMTQAQREAVAKRRDLDALNGYIERLDAMFAEAQSFTGYYAGQIEALDRRLFDIGNQYATDAPVLVRRASDADQAEAVELRSQRHAVEGERDAELARHTTTGSDGFHTLTFCSLRPDDIIRKRAHVVIVRDQVARELAAIEEQMTPGQLVESGKPASDYLDHRGRVATLRERLDTKAGIS